MKFVEDSENKKGRRETPTNTTTFSQLGFFASYPLARTRQNLVLAFRERGFMPMLPTLPGCVIQWSPYSKLQWKRAFKHQLVVSSYFSHHGLVNKVPLHELLQRFITNGSDSHIVDSLKRLSLQRYFAKTAGEVLDLLRRFSPDTIWVVKKSSSNNACGVYITTGSSGLSVSPLEGRIKPSQQDNAKESWLTEEYLRNPLLVDGKKFHLRCNVLAIGALRVFVHERVILHIASEPFTLEVSKLDDRFVHITNCIVQKSHEDYNHRTNMKELKDLCAIYARTNTYSGSQDELNNLIFDRIKESVKHVFYAIRKSGKITDFLPIPNAFEVFGFDFLIDERLELKLLEVNSGPALEGHEGMNEACCKSVVDDSVGLVVSCLQRAIQERDKSRKRVGDEGLAHSFHEVFQEGPKNSTTADPQLFTSEYLDHIFQLKLNCAT